MRVVFKYLGILLLISSIFRIFPIAVALYYKEPIGGFVSTMFISIALGASLYYFSRDTKSSLTLKDGLILTALSFIIFSLISSISFLEVFNYDFIDAFFESVSGYTTTGLSVMDFSLDSVPKSLLFWRAAMQWMGGIGIILVFVFVFSRLRGHAYDIKGINNKTKETRSLYLASGFPSKLESSTKKATFSIIMIYLGYTLAGFILLLLSGMGIVDSAGMAFTSISTGGFTMGDVFFHSTFQLIVLSGLMILGSISFIVHNSMFRLKIKNLIHNVELRVFFVLLSVMCFISFFFVKDFWRTAFQLVSSLTTTGYSLTGISALPQIIIFFIMISMIIGGAFGSTSGGVKLQRILVVFKGIPWIIRKLNSPAQAVIPFRSDGEILEEKDLFITYIFFVGYLAIIFFGTLIFMLFKFSFFDSSFQIISALGTVGLATMKLGSLNFLLKLVLIVAMLLGRLEIFPLLVLLRRLFKSVS